ncbi:tetratricopeptide repeat protein [Pseudanabaena sp. SR411]|uniref:CHAT domain-containing protein n=1 Tax=Pseudanabaena sp. SR411 TaxID=1980935 RepID=UPI001596287D|nr:tetratricopeptide repeat protein [Pseudanabaena sp. SR411]
MNLDSRKGFVKASRFYALMFVALTGVVGVVSPPDLVLMTVQAQTAQDRKAEADRLINQGNKQLDISQFVAALQSYQQALIIYREIKFRQGELWALGGTGRAYYYLDEYEKAIEFHLQSLGIAREIKDHLGEGYALGNLGRAYHSLGKYDKAIEFHLQSLTITREIKDRQGEGQSLGNLGNAYHSFGKYDKAIEFHLQRLEIMREIKDRKSEGNALRDLGRAYHSLGKYDKAIEFHLQRLEIMRETKDRKSEGNVLGDLVRAYHSLGKYDKVIEFQLQNLEILREIKDRQGEMSILVSLGAAYHLIGKYNKAIEFYLQSLEIAQTSKNPQMESDVLVLLSSAYYSVKNRTKADEYERRFLVVSKQIDVSLTAASILARLGEQYKLSSQYEKAILYLKRALPIIKKSENRHDEAGVLGTLGDIYGSLEQYDKAIDYKKQSLAIYKQIGDRKREAILLRFQGETSFYLGQYQNALDHYQQSLSISKQLGNLSDQRDSLIGIGASYIYLKQFEKAIEIYQQSLAISKQIGKDPKIEFRGIGYAYYNLKQYNKALEYHQQDGASYYLGLDYYALGDYTKAIEYFQKSLKNNASSRDHQRSFEADSLRGIADVLTKMNQPELAILYYKRSVNVTESIRQDIRKLRQEEQRLYLDKVADTYRNLADLLLKQDRILETQQVLDLLKVEELNEYLRTPTRSSQTEQGTELRTQEKTFIALALELDELQKRKLTNNITAAEQARLNKLVKSEQEQQNQFIAFLDSDPVQTLVDELRLKERQQNVDITNNFQNLRTDILARHPNAVLLYPLILEDRLELILITAKTTPIRRTINIKRENLNQEITDFLAGLRDASSQDVKKPAQQIYTWLIKPFETELAELKIDTIIYAPDGQLRYIPLAALYDGKQWLIEKYRVNNITAASLTKFNKPPIATPKIFAGAFGNVNKQGFSGLPATLTEVKKIADRFPNTTTLIETAFTKELTTSNSNSYTILHLATHGQLSTGDPKDSFIIFGDGEKATITDIRKWVLTNVDLVVLSACQSGLGDKLGSGVEILGLGYQMQAAGARVAIASLWKVDDAGTQALMDAFYAELKKGDVSIVEALRRAQIAMINSDKKGSDSDRAGVRIVGTVPSSSTLSHPYYWSAFFAIGNGL